MGDLMQSMGISNLSFLQIVTVAYIGALLGESQREIEDDKEIVLLKFVASWLSSGFLGALIGLLVKDFIFKDKPLAVISFAGYFGYIGNTKSSKFMLTLTKKFSSTDKDSDKKEKEEKDTKEDRQNKDK